MSIYDEMREVTKEILGNPDFKQGSTQLIRILPGSGPVDDPGPPVETSIEIDGAVRGVSWTFVQKSIAVGTDLQITHAAVDGVEPSIRDFVQVDGKRHKVKSVIRRPSAGVAVAYTLILES